MKMGKRALAVTLTAVLARAAVAQDADLDALLSRAVVLHQSGDLEAAAALYVQVLRAAPGASRIRSNLGAAYAGLGRYEEAIAEYRRALEGEDDSSIRQNLALSLQKAGHLDEAAAEAARARSLQPGSHAVVLLLANIELRRGRFERVVELLAPVVEAAPDDTSAAYLLGSALLELDRTVEAQAVLDRLFRDGSAEGHVLLGTLLAKRRDWPAALAEYEKARAANPKLPLVNYLVGEALMRGREDWAGAAAALRAELASNPYHFESNLLLGTLLLEGGSQPEALSHLELAVRLRPGDLSVKYPLGAAYLNAGRLEDARGLLEAVAAAAPGHLQTQMKLAVLYSKLGLPDEAARARASAAKLLKEADAQAFRGGKQIIERALGAPGAAPATQPDKP